MLEVHNINQKAHGDAIMYQYQSLTAIARNPVVIALV